MTEHDFDFTRDEMQIQTFLVANPKTVLMSSVKKQKKKKIKVKTRADNLKIITKQINDWLIKNDITEINSPVVKLMVAGLGGYTAYVTYYSITKIKPAKRTAHEIVLEACSIYHSDDFTKEEYVKLIQKYAEGKYNKKVSTKVITSTVVFDDD